jgi:hypothetical protein
VSDSPAGFRPIHYLIVVLAMVGVGLVSHFFDESPPELTLLKVMMVPAIALAINGADRRFRFDEAYRRWSASLIERVAVTSFISAASVAFLLAKADSPLLEIILNGAWLFLVFALLAVFGPLAQNKKGGSTPPS